MSETTKRERLKVDIQRRLANLDDEQLRQVDILLNQLQFAGKINPPKFDWPHAPVHRLEGKGTFIVTAGTYQKQHHFRTCERLDRLQELLLRKAKKFAWRLEAWSLFSNHYHFIGHALEDAGSLQPMLNELHSQTARIINTQDSKPDRKVWHNFWETELTYERSYLARLNYVHQNAVKHGLVLKASEYPWCSAGWFERTATRAQVKTIYGFKIDRLNVLDDFEVVMPE